MKKPTKVKDRCCNSLIKNPSSDECHPEALRIAFLISEIMSMPVKSTPCRQRSIWHMLRCHFYVTSDKEKKPKLLPKIVVNINWMQFLNLEDVCNLQTHKESLKKERSQCSRSISPKQQNNLYRDVFSRLKDDQGGPVNPQQYLIHCSSAGRVFTPPVTWSHQNTQRKDSIWEGRLFRGLANPADCHLSGLTRWGCWLRKSV